MKTDSKQVADSIKYYRDGIKRTVQDYLYSKMIAWSIQHLINPGFKIKVTDNVKIIPYNPKFQPRADQWDAQVQRLAKWLKDEPSKYIAKDIMEAEFFMHIRSGKSRGAAYVHVSSENTEQCEIEMIPEIVERPKLTGYCAALNEKKYLEAV